MGLPSHLRGDGPCDDCGTRDNIVWFTENPLWNEVCPRGGLVCIPCFVQRVDQAGLMPTGWRLLPDWHWTTRDRGVLIMTKPPPEDKEWLLKTESIRDAPGTGLTFGLPLLFLMLLILWWVLFIVAG